MGNTCFLNSCVQCLAHAPPFSDYFLSEPAYPRRRKKTILAPAMEAVVKAIHDANPSVASARRVAAHNPRGLLRAMDDVPPLDLFTDRDQHDSQEFLRMLLENLNDELNVVEKPPPYREEKDDFTEPENVKADRLWAQYVARCDYVMTRTFAGQLRSSVECHKCGTCSTSYDPFWDLSLPLRASKKGSVGGGGGGSGSGRSTPDGGGELERKSGSRFSRFIGSSSSAGPIGVIDCLRAFTEDETLEGSDTRTCPKCKVKGSATKRLRVKRWPRVLVIHLKRFTWGKSGRPGKKMDAAVDVPYDLSLGDFLADDALEGGRGLHPPKYKLFAVTNHMGSLGGGHYTASCEVGGGKWFTFNDENCSGEDGPPRVSKHAYVLFYALQ